MLTPATWGKSTRPGFTRILIGNDFSEDLRTDRGWTGWWVQRIAWFAEDGDILVLPVEPEPEFLDYVTRATGVDRSSVNIVVPPASTPEHQGVLTPERLAAPDFVAELCKVVGGRQLTYISALWPDPAVARLAERLDAAAALPGHAFLRQCGGLLLNSKSSFRAVAAGSGVAIPAGAVCPSTESAEQAIMDLLDTEEPVVVKHDFLSGGRGNEILSRRTDIRPVGARRVVPIANRDDVRRYLDQQWHWLSGAGRGRPVVERYVPDSSAFFAECLISDDGVVVTGDGELLSAPYAVGQIMPAQGLETEVMDAVVSGSRRLAEAVRAIGYRGIFGPDAIVTPEREVLFTEYNGRVTGSTHIYGRIGRTLVGEGYGRDRVILERVWPQSWSVPSFAEALNRLTDAGLAYDADDRTGVVLTNAFDTKKGVMYCIVAENLDTAWARDRALAPLFSII